MNTARTSSVLVIGLSFIAAPMITGCGGDKGSKTETATKQQDKESKWLGTYKNSKEPGTLVLESEHKGTLNLAGTKGNVTWEVAGDDKIIVHMVIPMEMFQTSDGSLRDTEGTVWKKT